MIRLFTIPPYELPQNLSEAFEKIAAKYPMLREVDHWVPSVWSALKHLQDLGKIHSEISFEESLISWVESPDHGIYRSYNVYKGALLLADSKVSEDDDTDLQIMALFHDLGYFLPYMDFRTGTPKTGNQHKEHPQIMADFFQEFGFSLGIKQAKVTEYADTFDHHDDVVFGKGLWNHMPQLGRYIADADKLFGLSSDSDAHAIVRSIVMKNMLFSRPKLDGWYFIRTQMNDALRAQFIFGDRWLSDNVSCIRLEKQLAFYSEKAIKLGNEIIAIFDDVATDIYATQVYDYYQDLYDTAKNNLQSVYLVAKGKDGLIKEPLGEQELTQEFIEDLYHKPLELEDRYMRSPYTEARGWNLAVEIDGELKRIDPSVVRFENKQAFLDAVRKALR